MAVGDAKSRSLTAAFVGLGVALLALQLWFRVGSLAVSVPYWDQWDFLGGLFEGHNGLELFLWQHGPHRQGLGGLAYALLYPATRWSARAEAFVAWAAIAAAAALALRLKLALSGRLGPADLLVGLAFFSASSFELFVGAQNLAHGPFPLLLVTLAALLARSIADGRRLLCLALAGVAALFTGFGLVLLPPLAVALALDLANGWRRREPVRALAGALALLAAGAALFLRGYRWLPASDCLERGGLALGELATFLGAMSGNAWGVYEYGARAWVDLRLALGFVLFALVAAAALRAAAGLWREEPAERGRWRAIFLLAGFSVGFALLTATGRSCLGTDSALASRYTLYAVPGMIGLYLWADGFERGRRRVALALLLLVLGVKELRSGGDVQTARDLHARKQEWVTCFRNRGDLDRCDRKSQLEIYPAERREASQIEAKLRFLRERELSLFAPGADGAR